MSLDKALILGSLGEYRQIAINDISLKLYSLSYMSIADSVGLPLPSTTLTQRAPKATEYREIT